MGRRRLGAPARKGRVRQGGGATLAHKPAAARGTAPLI